MAKILLSLMLLIWKFSLRHHGEVKDMWIINLWKGSGDCYNPPILLFLEKRYPRNRKKPAFDLNQKQVPLLSCVDKKDAVSKKRQEPAFCPASFLFPLTLEVFLWGHVSTWNPGDGDGWIFGTVAYTPRTWVPADRSKSSAPCCHRSHRSNFWYPASEYGAG